VLRRSRCWQVEGDAATISGMKRTTLPQRAPAADTISYAGYWFPPDVISYAVWLYYSFPLSLRRNCWPHAALSLRMRRCGVGR
jgi:hypothetical protein